MKFVKVLTPVILTGLLSFSAFAAEDQNAQMQGQAQLQGANQQLAAEAPNTQATEQAEPKHHKCKKCHGMHRGAKGKRAHHSAEAEHADAQQAESNQNQAPNQNS